MERTEDLHKLIQIYVHDNKITSAQEHVPNAENDNIDYNPQELSSFVNIALVISRQLLDADDIIQKMPSL